MLDYTNELISTVSHTKYHLWIK